MWVSTGPHYPFYQLQRVLLHPRADGHAHTDAQVILPTCTVALEGLTSRSQDMHISRSGTLLIIDRLLPEELVLPSGHSWPQEPPLALDRPSETGAGGSCPAGEDIPRSPWAENNPQLLCVYVRLAPPCTRCSISLHLSLSLFIVTSVYFITLPSRGHSSPVKETMTLLLIF